MKKVKVVKKSEVEVKPFVLSEFIHDSLKDESLDKADTKINKKELRVLAERLNLAYTEKEILFAKKIMAAYLAQR